MSGPTLLRVRKPAVVAALGAEATFFTHGLYTAVTPPGPARGQRMARRRAEAAAADRPGAIHGAGVREPAVGAPEVRGLRRPSAVWQWWATRGSTSSSARWRPARFAHWLDDDRRRCIWLPTTHPPPPVGDVRGVIRRAEGVSGEFAQTLARACTARDIELVVTPHPLDPGDYGRPGTIVVTGDPLDRVGVPLYSLLGSCDALVTDMSSVWVDFLLLDRPIGFSWRHWPSDRRKYHLDIPAFAQIAPGRLLAGAGDVDGFLDAVRSGHPAARPSAFPGCRRVASRRRAGAGHREPTELARRLPAERGRRHFSRAPLGR